jgi:F-type H+-transporting ATPase subunit delta
MREAIVARRYALALYRAAGRAGRIEAVSEDLAGLGALMAGLEGDVRFQKYLESPRATEAKRALLRRAFQGRISDLSLAFLELLLEKKRLAHLPEIVKRFQEYDRQQKGIVRAVVRTAMPLEADQLERLRKRLARLTGKTIEVAGRVDPDILGGVVVTYENQIIDGSVRRGLDDLRETLMKARVL